MIRMITAALVVSAALTFCQQNADARGCRGGGFIGRVVHRVLHPFNGRFSNGRSSSCSSSAAVGAVTASACSGSFCGIR